MQKRILLIGYNFHPEPTGIGKYSGEMMQWLARAGHACTAVTAYPYYPYWRVQAPYYARRFGYQTEQEVLPGGGQLTTCRCPMYVPANPSGLKRILLDFSFSVSALGRLLALALGGHKYDCVVAVAPSFQFGLLGIISQKLLGAKFVYHIQDMQIEAARDLQIIKSPTVINALFKLEKFIFRRADFISSISEGMVEKIGEKAGKPVVLFPNWVDNSIFYPLPDKAALKPSLRLCQHRPAGALLRGHWRKAGPGSYHPLGPVLRAAARREISDLRLWALQKQAGKPGYQPGPDQRACFCPCSPSRNSTAFSTWPMCTWSSKKPMPATW
ncbi:MAG: glycosyltransferase [Hymenobacter sp.]